jgi:hypothetical protein
MQVCDQVHQTKIWKMNAMSFWIRPFWALDPIWSCRLWHFEVLSISSSGSIAIAFPEMTLGVAVMNFSFKLGQVVNVFIPLSI